MCFTCPLVNVTGKKFSFVFTITTISEMYKSPVSIGVKFLNHSIIDVCENISNSLLFSSKQNTGGLKLTLILVQVSRCMEIMNVPFDLFVKCYLPAWFVLLRSRVHFRVCAAVWVLPQEPLFWKSLGKGGLWSAKQCQGHLSLTGEGLLAVLWTPRNHFVRNFLWLHISDNAASSVEWDVKVFVLWVWSLPEITLYCTPRITVYNNNKKAPPWG